MTRLPAPRYYEPPTGRRAHRVSRWSLSARHGTTRCGELFKIPGDGTLAAHPTRPVCRVCEPRRAVER